MTFGKTVRFYVVFEDGTEYVSNNFRILYEDEPSYIYILKDLYSMTTMKKGLVDIYINEPIFDKNKNLIEEVPLASYYELVPHRDYILKYKIYDLNIETSNFYNVITACVNFPLAVKSKGIFREEVNNVCSFGHTIDPGIFQDNLVIINHNGTTVYYLTKDILGLWKEMMG